MGKKSKKSGFLETQKLNFSGRSCRRKKILLSREAGMIRLSFDKKILIEASGADFENSPWCFFIPGTVPLFKYFESDDFRALVIRILNIPTGATDCELVFSQTKCFIFV